MMSEMSMDTERGGPAKGSKGSGLAPLHIETFALVTADCPVTDGSVRVKPRAKFDSASARGSRMDSAPTGSLSLDSGPSDPSYESHVLAGLCKKQLKSALSLSPFPVGKPTLFATSISRCACLGTNEMLSAVAALTLVFKGGGERGLISNLLNLMAAYSGALNASLSQGDSARIFALVEGVSLPEKASSECAPVSILRLFCDAKSAGLPSILDCSLDLDLARSIFSDFSLDLSLALSLDASRERERDLRVNKAG